MRPMPTNVTRRDPSSPTGPTGPTGPSGPTGPVNLNSGGPSITGSTTNTSTGLPRPVISPGVGGISGSVPVFHKGTDYVPKTGPAILKKGEAVLNTKDAAKLRKDKEGKMAKDSKKSIYGAATKALGGKEKEPKKEVASIHTKKAANGGYIHRHTHTHPDIHPDEEHVSPTQDAMVEHMLQHMGTPNPGEAEADAGQSGVPDAQAGSAPPAAGATPPTGTAPPAAGM